MPIITFENFDEILATMLLLMGVSLVLALLLMVIILRRIRRINLPPDADPVTALQLTPFLVVVMLDLLDFSLDFLSAPVSWTILTRLGLRPLRGVTVVEGLIPGTQFLPTMTLAWILARLTGRRRWISSKREGANFR